MLVTIQDTQLQELLAGAHEINELVRIGEKGGEEQLKANKRVYEITRGMKKVLNNRLYRAYRSDVQGGDACIPA